MKLENFFYIKNNISTSRSKLAAQYLMFIYAPRTLYYTSIQYVSRYLLTYKVITDRYLLVILNRYGIIL